MRVKIVELAKSVTAVRIGCRGHTDNTENGGETQREEREAYPANRGDVARPGVNFKLPSLGIPHYKSLDANCTLGDVSG